MVRLSTRSRSAELVFVDETAATTSMAYGFGPRRVAHDLRCGVPHGHYKAIHLRIRPAPERRHRAQAYYYAMNAETFEPGRSTISCRLWRKATSSSALDNPQGSQKPESGGNPGEEKLHGTIPAAIQPGLQPHRDGDFQTEKRAAKIGRAHRCRPSRHPGGLRCSLQAGRMRKLFRGLRV